MNRIGNNNNHTPPSPDLTRTGTKKTGLLSSSSSSETTTPDDNYYKGGNVDSTDINPRTSGSTQYGQETLHYTSGRWQPEEQIHDDLRLQPPPVQQATVELSPTPFSTSTQLSSGVDNANQAANSPNTPPDTNPPRGGGRVANRADLRESP